MTTTDQNQDWLTQILVGLVTHAAANARDRTFSDKDIPDMAQSMAKYYGSEIMKSQQAAIDKAVAEANTTGHWLAKSIPLSMFTYKYKCNCGYSSTDKSVVDGHVTWLEAALTPPKERKE